MADSEIQVHIKTTGDATGANATAQGIRNVEEAAKRLNPQVNELKNNQEKLAVAGKNTGNNLLQLSYAVDDLQHGLGAVVNNMPMVLQAFGLGAGLAGVLSIAAVGVNVLINNLDLFGEKADEAAKKAQAFSDKVNAAAAAAREHAEMADAQRAATLRHEVALQRINDTYDEHVTKINEATEALKRQRDEEQALEDVQRRQRLAEVDVEEAGGGKTRVQAEHERRSINQEFDRVKFERDQQISQGEAAKNADLANAAAKKAAEQRREAEQLERATVGLFEKEDRKALEAQAKAIQDSVSKAQEGVDKTPASIEEFAGAGPGGFSRKTVPNPARARAAERLREEQADLQRANDRLRADENARRRSIDDAKKEAERLRRDAEKNDEISRKAALEANKAKADAAFQAKLFPETEQVKNKEADARILRIQSQEDIKAAREEEKQSGKDSRLGRRFDREAGDLSRASGGLPPAIQRELEKALQQDPGSQAQTDFLKKLGQWMKKMNLERTKFARELEQLRAVVDEISDGR